jgi:ferrous iron transport protein A
MHDATYISRSRRGKHHQKNRREAHLENLGFVVGGTVTVVNAIGGNVIVNVKDSRVAVSKEMAQKIMV